jgi:hypothetical protein
VPTLHAQRDSQLTVRRSWAPCQLPGNRALTWDFVEPLTESNVDLLHHGSLCSSAARGRSPDLCEHEHTLALTSAGRAHTQAPFATQSATHFDLADEPSYEVINISSSAGRYTFTVSVRGLRPQVVYDRHAVVRRAGANNATQTVRAAPAGAHTAQAQIDTWGETA